MNDPRPLPIVIGTAGHIDHGKSALIEALTGTHPDRWQEEKERGITLDLGYAQFLAEDGTELGFVDVPGHERLVRKMVAGATGMGAAMLVVACDDGVMPQTREHFEVLRLLGLDHGLVALSKADLADEEMQELVRADVEELVSGTRWEACPMVVVSAHAGTGIESLRAELYALAKRARAEEDALHAFRLPVQRAFAMHGAGTVVTGICASGQVREGDKVEVMPVGQISRVRKVQVHGRLADHGSQGLRTALNLVDLEPKYCSRGSVVAAIGSLRTGKLIRAVVRALPGSPPLKHGGEVQVLAGTASTNGRIFLPPEDLSPAGAEERLVDLEASDALALVAGERLLLRRPSPPINLGAGRFLAFGTRRLRRKDADERELLQRLADALDDPVQLTARMLELGGGSSTSTELAGRLGWTPEATEGVLKQACESGQARIVGGDRYVGAGRAGALGQEVVAILGWYRNKYPHRLRIPVARIRDRLGKEKARMVDSLAAPDLEALGLARRPGLSWDLLDAEPPDEVRVLAEGVVERLQAARLAPPDFASLADSLNVDPGRVGAVVEYLEDRALVIQPAAGQVYTLAVVEELRSCVVEQMEAGGLDIPALRDRFETTRKFLMPLLEFFDERGVTVRRGPNRILRDKAATLV